MLTRNAFLVLVNLALVAGACEDIEQDLRSKDGPAAVPPMIGHAPDGGAPDGRVPATIAQAYDDFLAGKPWRPSGPRDFRRLEGGEATPRAPQAGPVELRQSRLDTWPTMGPCPDFGAPAGAGWTQLFRYASPGSAAYPNGQPNNCRQQPPQSHIPYLTPYLYPSSVSMNDEVRAFFGWVNHLQCLKVTFKEHDWGGNTLVYQACNTTPNTYSYVWSGNIQGDAGFNLGVTNVTVEWWAI